jgi:uncharacterized protein (TIGR02001 family)
MATHGARRATTLSLALSCAILLFASASQAENSWGGSLSATTDYIYRGLSQSNGEPAVQGGLYVRPGAAWTVGVWASTVDFSGRGDRTAEVDLNITHSWSLGGDWDAHIGVTHYAFPNDRARLRYDYDELIASLSFQQRLTATVSWSPRISRYGGRRAVQDRKAASYELTYLHPLLSTWSAGAGVGYYDLSDLFDTGYWYWNVGLVYSWERLQLDLTHINADSTAKRLFGYQMTGPGWSAALTWRF